MRSSFPRVPSPCSASAASCHADVTGQFRAFKAQYGKDVRVPRRGRPALPLSFARRTLERAAALQRPANRTPKFGADGLRRPERVGVQDPPQRRGGAYGQGPQGGDPQGQPFKGRPVVSYDMAPSNGRSPRQEPGPVRLLAGPSRPPANRGAVVSSPANPLTSLSEADGSSSCDGRRQGCKRAASWTTRSSGPSPTTTVVIDTEAVVPVRCRGNATCRRAPPRATTSAPPSRLPQPGAQRDRAWPTAVGNGPIASPSALPPAAVLRCVDDRMHRQQLDHRCPRQSATTRSANPAATGSSELVGGRLWRGGPTSALSSGTNQCLINNYPTNVRGWPEAGAEPLPRPADPGPARPRRRPGPPPTPKPHFNGALVRPVPPGPTPRPPASMIGDFVRGPQFVLHPGGSTVLASTSSTSTASRGHLPPARMPDSALMMMAISVAAAPTRPRTARLRFRIGQTGPVGWCHFHGSGSAPRITIPLRMSLD